MMLEFFGGQEQQRELIVVVGRKRNYLEGGIENKRCGKKSTSTSRTTLARRE